VDPLDWAVLSHWDCLFSWRRKQSWLPKHSFFKSYMMGKIQKKEIVSMVRYAGNWRKPWSFSIPQTLCVWLVHTYFFHPATYAGVDPVCSSHLSAWSHFFTPICVLVQSLSLIIWTGHVAANTLEV
jgi:hypothetical protein